MRPEQVSMIGADGMTEGVGPLRLMFAWCAIFCLGAAAALAHPLLAAPSAAAGKAALHGLLAGRTDVPAADLVALLRYASIVLLMPLAILAGFVALDRWMGGLRKRGDLAWPVQFLYLTISGGVIMILHRLELRPDPLIRIDRESGAILYWAQIIPLFLLAMIVGDMFNYWLHRAQHRFAWLWRFHAVHHSHDLDVLHGIDHPVDKVAQFLLVAIPAGMLVSVSATEIVFLAAFFSVQGLFIHMRSPINLGPLGVLLVDNRYHYIHHSRDPADYNCNFATRFVFVDRMFGTYRKPGPELPATGLCDRAPPTTLGRYLLASWDDRKKGAREAESLGSAA
jgi:sterol desaturase/sphingolipid hydroxylase (fatty acid hydroxylase superfamily)